jgi:hypothetical protein
MRKWQARARFVWREHSISLIARTYDELLAKHIPNDAQDGPHNQVNSSTAIEAEIVERETAKA